MNRYVVILFAILLAQPAWACRYPSLGMGNQQVYQAARKAKIQEILAKQKADWRDLNIDNPVLVAALDKEKRAHDLTREQTAMLSEFNTDVTRYEWLRERIRPVCAQDEKKLSSCLEVFCGNLDAKELAQAKYMEDGVRYTTSSDERKAFKEEYEKLEKKWNR